MQQIIDLIKKEQKHIKEQLDYHLYDFKKQNNIKRGFNLEKYGYGYLKLRFKWFNPKCVIDLSCTPTDFVILADTLIKNKCIVENDKFSLIQLNIISVYITEYNKLQETLVLINKE
jgi:hypothetical protein